MADLYDLYTRSGGASPTPGKPRRHHLALVVALAAAALVVLAVVLTWVLGTGARFHTFVSRLSTSTTQTYREGAFRADVEGQDLLITADNAYGLYTYLSITGQGGQRLWRPKEPPTATLAYADGAVLSLWRTDKGVAVIGYDSPDGYRYCYSNPRIYLESILLRYLKPSTNHPWPG